MSVWQLNRDILHSVYSEWLGWKDLSRLDIAFVEKNIRVVWLTSLTDLRMHGRLARKKLLPDNKISMFYVWLRCRKVYCIEGFPVRLGVLEDLVRGLDLIANCPILRSIEIERWKNAKVRPDDSNLQSNLSVILSHCHSLQGVRIWIDDRVIDSLSIFLSEIIFRVLMEKLKENTLIKLYLIGTYQNNPILTQFIMKHASSLKELYLVVSDGIMELITSTLIQNQIHLKVLNVEMYENPTQKMVFLISYLSSAGDLLETLEIGCTVGRFFNIDYLLDLVSAYCPKLTRLAMTNVRPCSVEHLRQLYQKCPNLVDLSIDGMITINPRRNSVTIEVRGSNEDWVVCLSDALRRRHYKQVTLRVATYYHPVGDLKSILGPYQIGIEASVLESSLITLLQDLPHLNRLHLIGGYRNGYTDAILTAIINEHANSLTELNISLHWYHLNCFHFSDKVLREMIEVCQLLTRLTISCCGLESLMAISNHSSLNMVNLYMAENVTEEMLDEFLLCDGKVKVMMMKRFSTLGEGTIGSYGYKCCYKFYKESHGWSKYKRNQLDE